MGRTQCDRYRFLVSRKAGRSLLALALILAFKSRALIRQRITTEGRKLSVSTVVLIHWALATSALSARAVFSDMATRFFQTGLTYFGGRVAALTVPTIATHPVAPARTQPAAGVVDLVEPEAGLEIITTSVTVPHPDAG